MFDWVPLASYTNWYYHILMLTTGLFFFQSLSFDIRSSKNLVTVKALGSILFLFVLLYMGTRPVSGAAFGDMGTYNRYFEYYASGGDELLVASDLLFQLFMKFCSQIMNNRMFFFVCAALYTLPAFVISKKWFKNYWPYAFLLLAGSFSFWAYGTNGIRNGLATSFFLMALCREKKLSKGIWLLIAVNIHYTLMLPTVAYIATWFYKKNQPYFYFWLACIPLSLLMGGFFQNLFSGLISDSRTNYLTEGNINNDAFSSTGFRWDFLVYSATGVFAGWYYIYKKKIKDKLYHQLFNIYLVANGFWILVIRSNFSNRFAYLSWFLLALVIVYPWLVYNMGKGQHKKLGYIMMAYVGFTYFMNFFYG